MMKLSICNKANKALLLLLGSFVLKEKNSTVLSLKKILVVLVYAVTERVFYQRVLVRS